MKKSTCIVALHLLLIGFARGQISEKKAIDYVKRLSPSVLDSTLPNGRFSDWLGKILGHATKTKWELNDCGEATGNPAVDTVRDLPTCVGVYANFRDGRKLGITIIVGTIKRGLIGSPAVFYMYLESHGHTQTIKRLSELKYALRQPSR